MTDTNSAPGLERRALGRSGLNVSRIGLGCVTFGREIGREAAFQVLDRAFERGINLFDTAESYGGGASEEILGAWLCDRKARERVVLATKASPPLSAQRISDSCEASLRRLGVEAVDLFQLHNHDPETDPDEIVGELDRLVRSGKARAVGVSNFETDILRLTIQRQRGAGLARMSSVQPMYNLVHREIEENLLPFCKREGLGVMTYSPLGAGFLTGKYARGGPLPEGTRFEVKPGHQNIYFSERGWRIADELRAIAEETGRTMVSLALAWALSRPGPEAVLLGARHAGHVDQAFEALESGLEAGLRERLDRISAP